MRYHKVSILGEDYTYRLLTRKELRELVDQSKDDPTLFEDLVCALCIVEWPPGYTCIDDCLAGIPITLCEKIMLDSGYSGGESAVVSQFEANAVEWAKTPESRIVSLICFCMPMLSKDAVENLDPEDFYYYAAMAQLIARGLYGMDVSNFLDPSQDEAKPNRGGLQRNSTLTPDQQRQFEQFEARSNKNSYLIP